MLFKIEDKLKKCRTKREFIKVAEQIVGDDPVYVQRLTDVSLRVWRVDNFNSARHTAYKTRIFSRRYGHPERRDEVFTSVKAAADYIFP